MTTMSMQDLLDAQRAAHDESLPSGIRADAMEDLGLAGWELDAWRRLPGEVGHRWRKGNRPMSLLVHVGRWWTWTPNIGWLGHDARNYAIQPGATRLAKIREVVETAVRNSLAARQGE